MWPGFVGEKEGQKIGNAPSVGRTEAESFPVGVGVSVTHLALGDQLSLSSGGRLDEGAGGGRDGLGRFENLFLKVKGLVRLLQSEKKPIRLAAPGGSRN